MYGDFLFRVGQHVRLQEEYHKSPNDAGVWIVEATGYFGTIVVCRISQGDRHLSVSQGCLITAEP
jgi:hypothetical protein